VIIQKNIDTKIINRYAFFGILSEKITITSDIHTAINIYTISFSHKNNTHFFAIYNILLLYIVPYYSFSFFTCKEKFTFARK